ncbi:MAG: MoaD/ThiS family protein [Sinobacteraceae bacterium]|nr:MoaD/ThiS family protein [Nevskiaceae bacterium]
MTTRIALYGALRQIDARGYVELDIPGGSRVGDLREKFRAYIEMHTPDVAPGLIERSAFASADEVLHDSQAIPEGVELAVLPPVSGG